MLLHHYMGEIDGAFRAWGFQKGGTGAISEAIASAARALGAEIRTDAAVAQVLVQGRPRDRRRARRTATRSRAPVVVSALDPRRTLPAAGRARSSCPTSLVDGSPPLQVPRLVGQGEPRAERAAGLHLPAAAIGPHLRGAISISPSIEYLERAYDDAKYGEFSRNPYMDIVIPSMIDPRHGAAGQARDVHLRAVRAVRPRTAAGTTRSARRSATR